MSVDRYSHPLTEAAEAPKLSDSIGSCFVIAEANTTIGYPVHSDTAKLEAYSTAEVLTLTRNRSRQHGGCSQYHSDASTREMRMTDVESCAENSLAYGASYGLTVMAMLLLMVSKM